ncbi:hypothetical protein ACRAQ6_05020 [Erythrobacter sp. HA6-11]
MRTLAFTLIAGTAIAFSGAATAQEEAEAQNRVYMMDGTMSDTKMVGGIGENGADYLSASWSETITVKGTDGSTMTELTSDCVGMTQDEGELFDRHVACTHANGRGSTGAIVMGCTREGPGSMSCIGYFQGKEGNVKGERSMMTVLYKWNDDGTGTMSGSGYWLGASESASDGEAEASGE